MESISGGSGTEPSKFKRFLAAFLDLFVIPVILGVVLGFLIANLSDAVKNIVLVLANIFWLVIRDSVFSPGRKLVGLKLISLTGEKVTPTQALIRNILLLVPVVLLIGYIVEVISVLAKNERLGDRWAKTRVVAES